MKDILKIVSLNKTLIIKNYLYLIQKYKSLLLFIFKTGENMQQKIIFRNDIFFPNSNYSKK